MKVVKIRLIPSLFLFVIVFCSTLVFSILMGANQPPQEPRPHLEQVLEQFPDLKSPIKVVFYAWWCPNCISKLQALKGDSSVLAIHVDDLKGKTTDVISQYFNRFNLEFPTIYDEGGHLAGEAKLTRIPYIELYYR